MLSRFKEFSRCSFQKVAGFYESKTAKASIVVGGLTPVFLQPIHADIVNFDQATGAMTWDFSTILQSLTAVAAGALTVGVAILLIGLGWGLAKKFCK